MLFPKVLIQLGCPRGVMVKALGFGIVVSEFERYYVQFRTNTLEKTMNPLILLAKDQILWQLFFKKEDFVIK